MNVGFIGAGSMGQMLIRALTDAGALQPGQITASNRTPAKLADLAGQVPGISLAGNAELAARCPLIFLAVKPREIDAVLDEIAGTLTADHLLIVLTNAFPLGELEAVVPSRTAKVIPSITQATHAGVALLMLGARATDADRAHLEGLLSAISHPVVIEERTARACADLTSVAPALVCALLQDLAQAAARRPDGPAPELAEALVRRMAGGVGRLLGGGEFSAAEVVRRVAVPGGLTVEALKALRAVPDLWDQILAVTARSEEERRVRLRQRPQEQGARV